MNPTTQPTTARRSDAGFTLIELLIVVVILGILAAVVTLAVGGATTNANEAACAADRRTVLTAVEAYRAETGSAPTGMGDLVTAGWLESASTNYDITGTALGTSAC